MIPDLLNVDHLMEGPIKHQIKCCSPTNAQSVDHTYGTLRDMHPSISVERVMANLSIDNENNRRTGVIIIEAKRLLRKEGDALVPSKTIKQFIMAGYSWVIYGRFVTAERGQRFFW